MNTRTKIDQWCEAVIEAGWLAALIVAPLFFNVFSSRVFEPDKISLVRSIMLVMVLAWLVKVANGGPAWLPALGSEEEGTTTWRTFWRVPFLVPILLLLIAYAVSTIFSVAPFVSWWGSYQRLQGTYTFISYVIIALLTMAHLRTPDQIRRLQHVVIVTSLPIAIYGVIQHYAVDPLPWGGDVTTRIAANAGNAIFLAAYMIMAVFLTLERIFSSFAFLLSNDNEGGSRLDMPSALAGAGYLFILFVQLLAIFWTQSRGPWLGLFLGGYVFVLLTISALQPRRYRALLGGWVGLGVLGIVVVVLMNTTALFNALAGVPYVGRLTQLLDQGSRTAQVRLLIWEGASDMVLPHAPLIYPDGSEDAVNPIRPLVGYGPEAMWVAYNPFYPPALAYVEQRNASPDRSHNETWDSLVITGVFGFIAYMSLFISIFYWALRWMGLLINRRDKLLFALLLGGLSTALAAVFYIYDGSWRYLGVAVPAGLEAGLVLYIMIAAFLHPSTSPDRSDTPRQLLLIAVLSTIAAHFVEIHFGIAIVATRTYFWILTALLLVLGMRWAVAGPFAGTDATLADADAPPADNGGGSGRKRRGRGRAKTNTGTAGLPLLPLTVVTDALMFLTFVFIYTTNAQGQTSATAILFDSFTQRVVNGRPVTSLGLLFLLLFTWLIAATLGLAVAALQRRQGAPLRWWLRGYGLHAAIMAGLWLVYGLFHARRLIPGVTGSDLDSQLNLVANHFAVYTWLVVIWTLIAGTVYAWPALRDQALAVGRRTLVAAVAGVLAFVVLFAVITNVNTALVRADVIYKQGQQFDSQRNWLSSVELYRRALAARTTEDHYMLFLGRALLEQAKQADPNGVQVLPANPVLDDVLALTPDEVNTMSREDLLRAAETVLLEAQTVNPLNTDHTANLGRLYRTWSDLSADPAEREEMLQKSIAQYNLAVTLSPNAAHLWNEKGNAHLAEGDQDAAEAAYRHSLEIDPLFEQTYLLLADLLDKQGRSEESVALLEDGLVKLRASPRHHETAAMYSYLGVAQSRTGDVDGALASNLKVLDLAPGNVGAMRNLTLLYRETGENEEAIHWGEETLAATDPARTNEVLQLRQLLAELYQQTGDTDGAIAQYAAIAQLAPNDVGVQETLYGLYIQKQDLNGAAETLQQMMTLDPANFAHPYRMAQLLEQVGQTENALTYAEQALDLAPPDQRTLITDLVAALQGSN